MSPITSGLSWLVAKLTYVDTLWYTQTDDATVFVIVLFHLAFYYRSTSSAVLKFVVQPFTVSCL